MVQISLATALVNAPSLPATALANYCYQSMFNGCTSLVNAPVLPATTLAVSCYAEMFSGCTSLVNAPALPATTLVDYCYEYMFGGCTNLVNIPALPAATLTNYCYRYMFYGCTNIKVSSTQTEDYTISYRIPMTGTASSATDALQYMFTGTGGTFTGTPTINTAYYLYNTNAVVGVTPYTVTLDAQGGNGGTASTTAYENGGMPSGLIAPTKSDYVFAGYYDGQNGTGTKYYNSDMTSAHVWDKTTNTTLYAYWQEE